MKRRWVSVIFLILILGIIVGTAIIQGNKSDEVSFPSLTGINEESITGIDDKNKDFHQGLTKIIESFKGSD